MNERTPLLTTVRVGPQRRRYPHNVLRRFCTIALSSTLIVVFGLLLFYGVTKKAHWPFKHHHGRLSSGDLWSGIERSRSSLSHERLTAILFDSPSSKKAEEWSKYYTSGPHLAGQNYSQAVWTREKWERWGIKSDIVPYEVYLNYPVGHSLSMMTKSKKKNDTGPWKVDFKASLEEDVLDEDPTTALHDRIPTFHGYSASGNVTASFVYVNYGSYQDFEDLRNANVSVKGKIAIARYGIVFRGLKVKRAQELGCVGVLLYSDPGEDGSASRENGYDAYPEGPARNPTSVERGSTQFLSIRPGDPSTPGYPSKPGAPRVPVDDATPSIPSIPISYADALPILKALNGLGPNSKDLNKYWTRNQGLGSEGVEYSIGPSPDNVVLNLYNEQRYVTTPLWNVIGVVNGTIPNEVIVVGNHRDAWIAGGAVDPNSGSAVLNEVIRSVSVALDAGWKPLRTIVFASWDGEEYGLLGSTEWVEEYLPWLSQASVAYLNVDVGVAGPHFRAAAAPLLHGILRHSLYRIPSPNQTVDGQTVGDVWDGHIQVMGSGSDFTAFQDFAGIPSIDMGFRKGMKGAYHYHSNYDSFHWMKEFGDPGFLYHKTMSQILALILAELSNRVVIRMRAGQYAQDLNDYLDKVLAKLGDPQEEQIWDPVPTTDDELSTLRAANSRNHEPRGDEDTLRRQIRQLRRSLYNFHTAAAHLDGVADMCEYTLERGIPWWKFWEKIQLGIQIAKTNYRYKMLDREFLFEGGLDGRTWFKHVVYAPGLWTGYAGAVFPGLMESIDIKDYENAGKWAVIIDGCVRRATTTLA